MSDAEFLDRLESLRKKKRTELKEGLVKAVMLQAGSFQDKIRRIEMIDLMPEEAPPSAPLPRRKGPLQRPAPRPAPEPETPGPGPDPALSEPRRVEQFRRRLTRLPVRGGFWAYLFQEFGALVRFGARTSTLTRGAFPFTLKLSPEALVFLGRTLQEHVLPVLDQQLPLAARKSWLHLTKRDYNLLAALRELVRTIASITVDPADKTGGGTAWDAVVPGLRLFWTQDDLVARTLQAWDLAMRKLGCSDKVRQGGLESIRTLLEARTDTLSLPDVLQAQIQLRCRRTVSLAAGVPSDPGEYFLTDSFDCSAEVQAEIDKAADILAHQLDVLDKESQEIQRIRYFLPDQDLLPEFEGGADRDNKGVWCRTFLRHVEASFGPFLGGTVVFADGSRTELLRNPSLDSTLARLKLLADQLESAEVASNPEAVAAAARVIMNLGKTLVVMIRNRSLTADPLVRSADFAQVTDPLPQEQTVVDLPEAWAGLTVIDAMVKAARVCLQAGRFLGETSLEASLEKEATLPSRALELLARLSRLVPAARVEGFQSRWKGVEAPAAAG